jgi:quercetin dioxygenase-like cupin family protein
MTEQNVNPESLCFCELVPLYALDLLDQQAREWVNQRLAESPELAEELKEYEMAIATLPYAVPPLPMAADLKQRLFQQIGEDLPPDLDQADQAARVEGSLTPQAVRNQSVEWQPYEIPGVCLGILHLDQDKREMSALVRAEAGVHYPLHRHIKDEEIFMLQGNLEIAGETYRQGDYIRSAAGSAHCLSTVEGCMFFIRASIDDVFVESESQ